MSQMDIDALVQDCSNSNDNTLELLQSSLSHRYDVMSRVSCQKGPTRHAYAWQIGPFWQDTLDVWYPMHKK